jgi:hypothetical protein
MAYGNLSDAQVAELVAMAEELTNEQWAEAEAAGDEATLAFLRDIKVRRAKWAATRPLDFNVLWELNNSQFGMKPPTLNELIENFEEWCEEDEDEGACWKELYNKVIKTLSSIPDWKVRGVRELAEAKARGDWGFCKVLELWTAKVEKVLATPISHETVASLNQLFALRRNIVQTGVKK